MKIFDWIQIKMIKRTVSHELALQGKRKIHKPKEIKKIGVLIDSKSLLSPELILKELQNAGYAACRITVLQYDSSVPKNLDATTNSFGDKDILMIGKPSPAVVHFCEQNFDLLINYFPENLPQLQLVSLRTKSKFRVGFSEVDRRLNDLIFSLPDKSPKLFFEQMNTYLKTIAN